MELNCDLHAHSGYAGGVGSTSLEKAADCMALKGIDVMATGDCLHPAWARELDSKLHEEDGLLRFRQSAISGLPATRAGEKLANGMTRAAAMERARFILQTEIIITSRVRRGTLLARDYEFPTDFNLAATLAAMKGTGNTSKTGGSGAWMGARLVVPGSGGAGSVSKGSDSKPLTLDAFDDPECPTEELLKRAKPGVTGGQDALGPGRKEVHTVLLFPHAEAARAASKLMVSWGMKNTMGRPFLTCDDSKEVASRMHAIKKIDDGIEIIPAHVMTPDGIYGSDNPVDSMEDFFGDFTPHIKAVETGLSADPDILSLVPELHDRTLVSSSDAHSPALNRMGREFTRLSIDAGEGKPSYAAVVEAIRKNKVAMTAEFEPTEGRYFLTGHRADKEGHATECYFGPSRTPMDAVCPECNRTLTIGVMDRAITLAMVQGKKKSGRIPERKFVTMVPLTEMIAAAFDVGNPNSKKVLAQYDKVVAALGSESCIWTGKWSDSRKKIENGVDGRVLDALDAVFRKEFCFWPPGFDGTYGKLVIGKRMEWGSAEQK